MYNYKNSTDISLLTILTTLQDTIDVVQEVAKGKELENGTTEKANLILKQFKKDFPEGAGNLVTKKEG